MFDAIVFDNDGLLLDTEEAWTRAQVTLFERYGRSFGEDHKRSLLGTRGAPPRSSSRVIDSPAEVSSGGRVPQLVMEEAMAGVPAAARGPECGDTREAGGVESNPTPPVILRAVLAVAASNGHST